MMLKYFIFLSVVLSSTPISTTPTPRSGQLWADRSPHKSGFVTIDGVRHHYLDWGGRGEALLFLPGAGNSAHIFDDIAPKFTDRFRVLALTRRGIGESDKPETGYDRPTLTEDIRRFLDALHIRRVHIAGHSLAGDMMTLFARLYPGRVGKLIYLDAAYDREAYDKLPPSPIPPPPQSEADRASFAAFRRWYVKTYGFWSNAMETDARITMLAPDGNLHPPVSPAIYKALAAGRVGTHPDYTKVKAPSLSFYVLRDTLPRWLLSPYSDDETRRKVLDYMNDVDLPYQRRNIEQFRREMARGRVIEMRNTAHHCFIKNEGEVVREMRAFLLGRRALAAEAVDVRRLNARQEG
jgi:pimeloyl-ACP methyl ester carboxylesterase